MNRWLVLEALADRDSGEEVVKMQVLNIHASATAAYWYWGVKGAEHRLFLIDLQKHTTYTWEQARRVMVFEQLKALENGKLPKSPVLDYLLVAEYMTVNGSITVKGNELLLEFEPYRAQLIQMSYVPSETKTRLS